MTWLTTAPEIFTLFMTVVFLVRSMARGGTSQKNFAWALVLSGAGLLVSLTAFGARGALLAGVYRVDLFSQLFKGMLSVALFMAVCLCSDLKGIAGRRHPDFYFLLAVAALGMMLLVSSVDLLMIYLSLELMSYPLYVLVPLRVGEGGQTEAGIKYFLLGIVASALTLMGMAFLFGAAHTTHLSALLRTLPALLPAPMAAVGMVLTLSGFFFKLAVFPFHVWAPSVYEGAANQVAAYIGTAAKVAAIAVLIRLSAMAGGDEAVVGILALMAVASMTLGNLAAIVQKDLKRLLAYSAIAQAGYVLIGILSMSTAGLAGAAFYALAYPLMAFACFLVVVKMAPDGRSNLQISQLAGLHRRAPILAATLLLGVFGLGGIPPTIGFTGKFLIFMAAVKGGHFWLVLIAMVNVVVSLYYYALVVKAAYLDEPQEELPPVHLALPTRLLALAMILAIVIGGLFPQHIYAFALAAVQGLQP